MRVRLTRLADVILGLRGRARSPFGTMRKSRFVGFVMVKRDGQKTWGRYSSEFWRPVRRGAPYDRRCLGAWTRRLVR